MHKPPNKSKFFNQNNTPEQDEDDENKVFRPEMSEAYAGASSAAAQPKKMKEEFFGVKEEKN